MNCAMKMNVLKLNGSKLTQPLEQISSKSSDLTSSLASQF